jgi:hypothetical protein
MNQEAYWEILKPLIPRILGQLDRDPDSPTYGSFDRNFWNYKIRDFSSAIIQQGFLVLDVLYKYDSKENPFYKNERIKSMIEGSVNYWTHIQLRNGSFNEYYPYEAGFPPTAFSLYAVSLIMDDDTYTFSPDLNSAIEKAIAWILKNPEKEALNQECAALSGICIATSKTNIRYNRHALDARLEQFYHSQSPEGWFNEYNGPDIGYLSVTIDCLTDVYEITGDKRAKESIDKAIKFINAFVTPEGFSPVMINSRNTDYILPYAIARAAVKNNMAKDLLSKLFAQLHSWKNQLYKTDDRYLCHYIGQSFFRTLFHLPENLQESTKIAAQSFRYFAEAGIFIFFRHNYTVFVSLQKGGIFSIYNEKGIVKTDFGYRILNPDGSIAVTHWQDPAYTTKLKTGNESISLWVKGTLTNQKYLRPSPFKHMALRIASRLLGNKIIPVLKKQLIFREKKSPYDFIRQIAIDKGKITVEDEIIGLNDTIAHKAKHYSMRHVSSAGRFCSEELLDKDKQYSASDFPLREEFQLS